MNLAASCSRICYPSIEAMKFELHKALIIEQDRAMPAVAVQTAYSEGVRGLKKRLSV